MIIGIDLDNTIIDWDACFYKTALEWELVPSGISRTKKTIRDHIRTLPNGEETWTELQSHVYVESAREAPVCDGVQAFLRECFLRDIPYYIISHKTEYPNVGDQSISLRTLAIQWLEGHEFPIDRVHFGATREKKIELIKKLSCTHFIDDLLETFQEASFPQRVKKILYDRHHEYKDLVTERNDIIVATSWKQIYEILR